MDKYQIPYINMIIQKFGERHNISRAYAFSYLKRYGGMQYLIDFYDIEHTLPVDDTLDELTATCKTSGGYLI